MIFSEFAKIDAGRLASAKGSGLGLALTQAFVVAMGGTITVYTRPGSGSTFVVRLPLEAGAAKAAA
jgi:two-component system sensor histidine kinase SenX3